MTTEQAERRRREAGIDYKDIEYLGRFVGPQGQILSRRRTGFTAQRQKQLKRAIKRARHLALMPFVG
jgi:small subunit ribosomal protein S18